MNQAFTARERRRTKRAACDAVVRYQTGEKAGGATRLVDVDQHGVCLWLAHPVRFGGKVLLEVAAPKRDGPSVEMKGRVAWCEPSGGGYRAGVRVYHDEPESRVALCALMCAALKRQAAIADVRDRHFRYAEWKLAALEASERARTTWETRRGRAALAADY